MSESMGLCVGGGIIVIQTNTTSNFVNNMFSVFAIVVTSVHSSVTLMEKG